MPHKTSYIHVIQRRGYKLYLQALVLQHVFHGYHHQRKKVSETVWKRLYPWIMQTFVIQSSVKRTSKHSDIINQKTAQDSLPDSLPITYPLSNPQRHTLARTDISSLNRRIVQVWLRLFLQMRVECVAETCGAVFQPANSAVALFPPTLSLFAVDGRLDHGKAMNERLLDHNKKPGCAKLVSGIGEFCN